jgi:hypothetical protein
MARTPITEIENQGVFHNLIALGTSIAEQALGVGFGLAEDVVGEARRVVGLSIDLLEAVAQGAAKVARQSNGRVGDLLSDSVARGQSSARSVVRLFRFGGEHATTLAGEVLVRASGVPETGLSRPSASAIA